MKKVYLCVIAAGLFACNEANDSETTGTNPDGTSSIVATTNPEVGDSEEGHEHHPGDGHDHGTADGDITTIEYVESKHNFGNVFYPSENKHTFKFKNTGNFPLIIEQATATCGCTVPNKPDKPIMPGETGELDVIFRPKEGQVGQTVSKTITVVSNTVPAESYLEITATVMQGM